MGAEEGKMTFIAPIIRGKRESLKKSLRGAAKEIGISAATLSRIEGGKAPTFDNYVKIARWLQPGGDAFMQQMEIRKLAFDLDLAKHNADMFEKSYENMSDKYYAAITMIGGFYYALTHGELLLMDDLERRFMRFIQQDETTAQWLNNPMTAGLAVGLPSSKLDCG
jgi:transcriptional regulator with XRE-family HTH domain